MLVPDTYGCEQRLFSCLLEGTWRGVAQDLHKGKRQPFQLQLGRLYWNLHRWVGI